MPQLYEVHFLDRLEAGLNPWKYSGSHWNDRTDYFGSSTHKDYRDHLKISMSVGKAKKIIVSYYNPGEITEEELRKAESVWQISEGHVLSDEYYNLTDRAHPVAITEESRGKISATLKRLGKCPYCANTHSSEAIEKRMKSIRGRKWYHDPITLSSKWFLPDGIVPEGWAPGKMPRKPIVKKPNLGNTRIWVVKKNGDTVWEGNNLTKWCEENGIPGLKLCPKGIKVVRKKTAVTYTLSTNKTVVVNSVDTGLRQSELADKLKISRSSMCARIANGEHVEYEYDIWTASQRV
jgi:hypothetical protein